MPLKNPFAGGLLAAVAGLSMVGALAAPGLAAAQPYGDYRPSYQRPCHHDNGAGAIVGALIGAGLGAVLGSNIAADGHRGDGTALGAGVGALAGGLVGSSATRCDYARAGPPRAYAGAQYSQGYGPYGQAPYGGPAYGYAPRYAYPPRYAYLPRYAYPPRYGYARPYAYERPYAYAPRYAYPPRDQYAPRSGYDQVAQPRAYNDHRPYRRAYPGADAAAPPAAGSYDYDRERPGNQGDLGPAAPSPAPRAYNDEAPFRDRGAPVNPERRAEPAPSMQEAPPASPGPDRPREASGEPDDRSLQEGAPPAPYADAPPAQ